MDSSDEPTDKKATPRQVTIRTAKIMYEEGFDISSIKIGANSKIDREKDGAWVHAKVWVPKRRE